MTSKTELNAKEILDYFKVNQKKMISFLERLVVHESPSGNHDSQVKILKLIGGELKKLGFHVMYFPGKQTGGHLYARPQNRFKDRPLQLIVGHCDTVWEMDTLSTMPIREKNGRMTGPGIYDMKAGLTQLIFSLKAIKELGLSISLEPIIIINSDEEIGSRESTQTISRIAKITERAFVLEPPLGLDGKLKTARKGVGRFTITVKGKAAHAGLDPEKGINAIVELSNVVQQLYAMNDFENGITVNVGMIQGGISANVVAPESKAVIDVRVLNQADGDKITEQIYALRPSMPDVELYIDGGIGRPPLERTERNRLLWQLAKTKGALLGLKLEEGIAGGGSDGNTTSMYTATLDGLGTTGDGAHAVHEFIFLDELPVRTALLTLLLLAKAINSN
jgi:glutamate carboxypeptidase